jgi:hypothetical protein
MRGAQPHTVLLDLANTTPLPDGSSRFFASASRLDGVPTELWGLSQWG